MFEFLTRVRAIRCVPLLRPGSPLVIMGSYCTRADVDLDIAGIAVMAERR